MDQRLVHLKFVLNVAVVTGALVVNVLEDVALVFRSFQQTT